MGAPGKQESTGKVDISNLLELEETSEAPDDQEVLTYIKRLATYVSDLVAAFLGLTCDAEASALVLIKYLESICIRTEAAHGTLGQDKSIEREHETVWESIRNSVELTQKRTEEATVATLKT